MNVDKMRRYSAAAREAAEVADREAWLTTLTPEHRAMHGRGLPCGLCISTALGNIGRRVQRL